MSSKFEKEEISPIFLGKEQGQYSPQNSPKVNDFTENSTQEKRVTHTRTSTRLLLTAVRENCTKEVV